tara:strand:+ start:2291 stop:2965 length:675 start_codon:yes stop_codon:yes gene_type:complete
MISLTTDTRPNNPNIFGDYSQKENQYLQAYKENPLSAYNTARYNEVMFAKNPEFARPEPSRGMTGSRPMLGMLGSMSQPTGQQFTIKNPSIKKDFMGRTQEQRMMVDLGARYREEQAIKQRDAERRKFMDDDRRRRQEASKLAEEERKRKKEAEKERIRQMNLDRKEKPEFTELQQFNLDTFAQARPSGSIFGATKSMSVPQFGGSMNTNYSNPTATIIGSSNY